MSLQLSCRSPTQRLLSSLHLTSHLGYFDQPTSTKNTSSCDPLAILDPRRMMRLLRFNNDRNLSLTEFFESDIPKYAILSHRWGAEEVTFADLMHGTGKIKVGYNKIQFCGEQARRDKLDYFWVDTCCIIQTHHRRQRPTKGVAYAAENGGRTYGKVLINDWIVFGRMRAPRLVWKFKLELR